MNELPTEAQIYDYLQRMEPFDGEPVSPLPIFDAGGDVYRLHVDVNQQDDKYGYMWEWWVQNQAGYVDGGFVPANSKEEVRQLAGLIRKSCADIIRKAARPPA